MDEQLIEAILPYLAHFSDCDNVQPMWHKGPCDYGWSEVQERLKAVLPPGVYERALEKRQEINRKMYARAG